MRGANRGEKVLREGRVEAGPLRVPVLVREKTRLIESRMRRLK